MHADRIDGPREVARHALTTPGRPSIRDEHYPPRPPGTLERRPRARSREEQAFLAIGSAAEGWLIKAAAAGTQRMRRKMAEADDLPKLHGPEVVNHALETCARAGRFADGDLASWIAFGCVQIPNVVALVKPLPGTESDLPYVRAALRSRVRTPHMLDERAATDVLQVRQFANSCWRRTEVTASSLE